MKEIALIIMIVVNTGYLVARDFSGYDYEMYLDTDVACSVVQFIALAFLVFAIYKVWIIYRQHFKG